MSSAVHRLRVHRELPLSWTNEYATARHAQIACVVNTKLIAPFLTSNRRRQNVETKAIDRKSHPDFTSFLIWDESDVIHAVADRVTRYPIVTVISSLCGNSLHAADCTQIYIKPLSGIVIPNDT